MKLYVKNQVLPDFKKPDKLGVFLYGNFAVN